MKRIVSILSIALALLVITPLVHAQVQPVPASVTLNYTLPTKDVTGNNLTGALAITKVQIFLSTSTIDPAAPGTPFDELLPVGGVVPSTTTKSINVPNHSTVFVRVAVCNVGGCSVLTNEATGIAVIPVPEPATNLTITIKITAP